MKYIVKNCDSYNEPWCGESVANCHNCTDCLIKRVIEKCNSRKGTIMENFAEQILDMFEIEEINK